MTSALATLAGGMDNATPEQAEDAYLFFLAGASIAKARAGHLVPDVPLEPIYSQLRREMIKARTLRRDALPAWPAKEW